MKNEFKILKSFDLTVPSNFDSKSLLDSHGMFVTAEINSENFKNFSGEIQPGEVVKATLWEVLKLKHKKECLKFLEKLPKVIFLGAHGAILTLKYYSNQLPLGSRVFSFDIPEYLGKKYTVRGKGELYVHTDNITVVPYINTEEDREAVYGIRIEVEKFDSYIEGKYDNDFPGRKIEYLLSFQKM